MLVSSIEGEASKRNLQLQLIDGQSLQGGSIADNIKSVPQAADQGIVCDQISDLVLVLSRRDVEQSTESVDPV